MACGLVAPVHDLGLDEGRPALGTRVVVEVALAAVPAVVAAHDDAVDLLAHRLADVADPELAGLAVEAHAPGIAEPKRPELVQARRPHEGVVGRNRVGHHRNVEAHDLAVEAGHVLRVVVGVAAAAAIAHRVVEEPIGSEREVAAVVVGLLLREAQDGRIGPVRRERHAVHADVEARDHVIGRTALRIGEESMAIAREIRREREVEEALLAAGRQVDQGLEIEGQGPRAAGIRGEEGEDLPALLDRVPTIRVGRVLHEVDGLSEAQAAEGRLESDGRGRRRWASAPSSSAVAAATREREGERGQREQPEETRRARGSLHRERVSAVARLGRDLPHHRGLSCARDRPRASDPRRPMVRGSPRCGPGRRRIPGAARATWSRASRTGT